MGKRHRAEATQHTKHHADEHIRDQTGRIHDAGYGLTDHTDDTFDHTQGGMPTCWAEAPASYLPPPETLETSPRVRGAARSGAEDLPLVRRAQEVLELGEGDSPRPDQTTSRPSARAFFTTTRSSRSTPTRRAA